MPIGQKALRISICEGVLRVERGWRWDDGGRFQLFQLQPATRVSGQALHVAEKKKQGAIK